MRIKAKKKCKKIMRSYYPKVGITFFRFGRLIHLQSRKSNVRSIGIWG